MVVTVLKGSKNEAEIQLENLTLAELLRVYLNEDSDVVFAAWKRDHPSEKPILKIETKGKVVKKAINDAISLAKKELIRIEKDFEKAK